MFGRAVYEGRRRALAERLGRGLLLFPGNGESPMNYADNAYPFRQDSTFLYYFGLSQPELAAVLDAETGVATLFGDELTLDMIVWTGELPTIAARAEQAGVSATRPLGALSEVVGGARARGREIHYLPPYRSDTTLLLSELLGTQPREIAQGASVELIRAVVDQRAHKAEEEIAEIEQAVAVSVRMHEAGMRLARPGVTERAIAAEVERIANEAGRLSFPIIGTINGQTLHNHSFPGTLAEGRLYLLDAGAETVLGYAGDLTSTCPVSERFTGRQRTIYELMLSAYDAAVATLAPGVPNRAVHFAAARVIFEGMKDLGLMKGDTEAALAAGAHALVFPHGIGHMMGLDVHDMENLGEQYVGYGEGEARSKQFGLKSLRLARPLEPGFVLTIEPGIYFIPQLIDAWRAKGHLAEFIDYDEVDRWRDFSGVRNEENWLITASGARRLGPRKPQTVEELAAVRASA
jgi:Xaa-Pro aminopeptidase